MKKIKNLKTKIISFFIIVSILYLPFFAIPKTEAQTSYGNNPNLGTYVKDLGPVIQALPLCKQTITNSINNIFSKATGNAAKGVIDEALKEKFNSIIKNKDEGENDTVSSSLSSVPIIVDKNTENKLNTIDNKVSSLEANDTCLKSIGRLVIKRVLQKITTATADWIASGFNGGPAFVQDPGQFFKDLAKNEILQFGSEINNPELYPFGKSFMINTANSYKSTFAQNARYSLDKLIKEDNPNYSASGFMNDFSQGGWDAWLYMTQNPANNPIGFQLMASNELSKRIENIDQQTQNQLNQSGGFLGDIRCVNPKGVTQEEHQEALKERASSPTGPYQYRKCEKWEYVTPGAIVANAATKLVDYPDNNLLKADDLNDALAVLIDTLINTGFNYLTEKGLAYLNEASSGGNYDLSGYSPSQIYGDYTSFAIEASSWLKQNPNFNIRTDLNQALIDEQRIYIDKLKLQNKELGDLILVTRQLDYCIPGPNPRWENESWETLNNSLNSIPSFSPNTSWNWLNYIPLSSIFYGIFKPMADYKNELEYNAGLIEFFTDIPIVITNLNKNIESQISSKTATENVLKIIFQKYADIIRQIYTENPNMPLVTEDAKSEYLRIPSYQKLISENETKINLLSITIGRLNSIKTEIDKLNKDLEAGTLDQNKYEENLKPILDVFGRMSVDLVSGDNIANVDNIYKTIKDKKEYIYKDLLKGPYGCEKELEANKGGLPWQFFTIKRMEPPYLSSLLYDYNKLNPNSIIPDPWNSGYSNKMNGATQVYGPAFLSYTAFLRYDEIQIDKSSDPAYYPNYLREKQFNHKTESPGGITPYATPDSGLPLFITDYKGAVAVGRGDADSCLKGTNNYKCTGKFEYMINVY